ncbi:MAG: glucosamine-6-phosphate deaminase [Chloroflexota bacterium]|nr:glucosamine-6-phosphate deaminase [Chloroflexota bacterium]
MGENVSVRGDGSEVTIEIVADAAEMGHRAADIIATTVAAQPDAVLAVPTGSTPLPMFAEVIARRARGEIDLSRVHLFCLDEYLGMPPERPNSLTGWLLDAFIEPAGIAPERLHVMPATDPDPERAAAAYEADLVALGGLTLAVVGLGPNGHVAYNEPGTGGPDSRTRIIELTPESISQAAGYWPGEDPVPSRAMTMGIGTLLGAGRIVLIVTGAGKASILHQALHGPMTDDVPASWLRLAGDRLLVIADRDAASQLPGQDSGASG